MQTNSYNTDEILNDLIERISLLNISKDVSTVKSARIKLLQANALILQKLSETSQSEVSSEQVIDYCSLIIEQALAGQAQSAVPEQLITTKNKHTSSYIKQAISNYTNKFCTDNGLLQLAFKQINKSKTIAELKAALKVYAQAAELTTELQHQVEHSEWLSTQVDELDQQQRQSLDYKQKFNEVINVMDASDEDYFLLVEAEAMIKNNNLNDTEACKVLGITRNKLNSLRRSNSKN